jgi:hypothetical protein
MTKLLVSITLLSAVAYTLFVAAMLWFNFAFFGFDAKRDVGGAMGIGLFALSPAPVCIYCLKRIKALLKGQHPRI